MQDIGVTTSERPSTASVQSVRPPILSIVVPTFNETENLRELVRRLEELLSGYDWEVVFVDDDSTDGSTSTLFSLAQSNPRVRFLHRIGRRGLSSAVIEGILSTSAPYVAVMDADLQHDENCLLPMIEALRTSDCDVVIGSRYLLEGGIDGWNATRATISQSATKIAQVLLHVRSTDPMSGFFMLRREAFNGSVRRLSVMGYKILLDILVSAPKPLKIVEIPYVFRNRVHGESKLDSAVAWEYIMLLLDKTIGRAIPVRFVMFMAVGGLGVIAHMLVLAMLNRGFDVPFVQSQLVAAMVAMTANFFANNALTYRDKRLKTPRELILGLLSFYAVCSLGAVSNVGIAAVLFNEHFSWWLSGISGILVGAVWNYAASSIFTWRK